MSLARWMAIASLVVAPVAVTAQEESRLTDPSDPAAAVASYRYESALSHYQSIPENDEAPHKAWHAANDEMGKLGGHAGHIKVPPPRTGTAASPQPEAMPARHGNHEMRQRNKGQ